MTAATQRADTRIPYGSRCTWWDSIDKIATVPGSDRGDGFGGLPCCPGCGCMLFEVQSEAEWWAGAARHEANGNPGYCDMLRWARGKCFPTFQHMKAAYDRRPRDVTFIDNPKRLSKRRARRLRGRR